MPEVLDPRILSQIKTGPTPQPMPEPPPYNPAPQPFPGAGGGFPKLPTAGNPSRQAREQATMQHQANVDRRADTSILLEAERNARAAEEHRRKIKALDANGGAETTASEDQAAGHAVMLGTALQTLDTLAKKDPRSLAPTWAEKAVKGFTNDDPDLVAWSQSGGRQVSTAAYKNAIESAVWLSTGAAAPKDQVDRISSTIMPTIMDKPETLLYKRHLLEAYIQQAKARAGPANIKVQKALDSLQTSMPILFGDPDRTVAPVQGMESSTKDDIVPVPPELQAEFAGYLKQHPPGTVDLEGIKSFYKGLAQKYGRDAAQIDESVWPAWVETYNKGKMVNTTVPGTTVPKRFDESWLDTPEMNFLGNAANAGLLGLPERFAGPEGRQALELANEKHPAASLLGDVAGSVAPIMALEKGAGKIATSLIGDTTRAKLAGDVAANSLYGAERAMNSNPENEGEAALLGGTIGGAAALGGNMIAKGVVPMTSAEHQAAMKALPGVDLTAMQKMGLGHYEEAARGVLGPHGERNKSLESFAMANLRDAAATAGESLPKDIKPGFDGVGKLADTLDSAYGKIMPKIVGKIHPRFVSAIGSIKQGLTTKLEKDLYSELIPQETKMFNAMGEYDGASLKDTLHFLQNKSADWYEAGAAQHGNPDASTYRKMAEVADKMRKEVIKLVALNTPAEAKQLAKVDKAWAKLKIIEHAAIAGRSNLGVYSPGQYLNAIFMRKGANKVSAARGKGYMQDRAVAGIQVMGGKGESEPMLWQNATGLGTLGAASYASPTLGKLAATGLAALYLPGVKQVTKAALTGKRPAVIDNPTTKALLESYLQAKMGDK